MSAPAYLSRAVLGSLLLFAGVASAAPYLRFKADLHGDFVMFGNTLALDCEGGVSGVMVPIPTVGVDCSNAGPDGDLTAADIFWRSDFPTDGTARANATVTPANARSSAVFRLPPTATIAYARFYWQGFAAKTDGADATAALQRKGGSATTFTADITRESPSSTRLYYESSVDITTWLKAQGQGTYTASGINNLAFASLTGDSDAVSSWMVVVFYELPSAPLRNLTLFDSLDLISGSPIRVILNGFHVPNSAFDAKLGILAFEGDDSLDGDKFRFRGGIHAVLTDADNLSDGQPNSDTNFFNGSRTYLGKPVSNATLPDWWQNTGDLPQLSGEHASMGGMDLDVVDVTSRLERGESSATVEATTSGDRYFLGSFVVSITTHEPSFSNSPKRYRDLNGGALLPGDVLEYTIDAVNTGSDEGRDVVMVDPLPLNVDYVPGSLQVASGPNAGAKTDAVDGDQAEYLASARAVVVRLGTGADSARGGRVLVGERTSVVFHVTVTSPALTPLRNQAVFVARGKMGSPPKSYASDGATEQPGSQPTEAWVDQCSATLACAAPTPLCLAGQPSVCVACTSDASCGGATPVCSPRLRACAASILDTDGDGLMDAEEALLGSNPSVPDTDGDSVPDGEEVGPGPLPRDTDGDGLLDVSDNDDDGDGIPTLAERSGAADPDDDSDGLPNRLDADDDGDFLPTAFERPGGVNQDTDGNGVPDHLQNDDDADGLDTGVETLAGILVRNTDADARPDFLDPDDDGDGIPTAVEVVDASRFLIDVDADGTWNFHDLNSDGDATPDQAESTGDIDGDGIPNYLDANDADGPSADIDADGLSNGQEATLGTNPFLSDSDDDGLTDAQELGPGLTSRDTDGDGVIDPLDPDDDNDGIPTTAERPAGQSIDTDGDGTPDFRDPDDDGDGIPTLVESSQEAGRDTEGDGVPAWLDLDSDGDGVTDAVEAGAAPNRPADSDRNGTPDYLQPDSDSDGVLDATDNCRVNANADQADTPDGDGLGDVCDPDDDNDTVPDTREVDLGSDPRNPDTDGDSVTDDLEVGSGSSAFDTDGDGILDVLDDDDDGDGIPTSVEAAAEQALGASPDRDLLPAWRDTDSDGDTLLDRIEGTADTDGDGVPNFLDVDSDGDGTRDVTEGNADTNGDGIPDYLDPKTCARLGGGGLLGCSAAGAGVLPAALLLWVVVLGLTRRRARE